MTGRPVERVSAAVQVSDEMAAHFRDNLPKPTGTGDTSGIAAGPGES